MRERIQEEKSKRKPRPIDVIVGRNLMIARTGAGLSQARLGETVGLTFQQIQKYEHGVNRLPLSRAWEFAAVLGISITDFFEELPDLPRHADRPAYARWVALYRRALGDGVAREMAGIAEAVMNLRDSRQEECA